LAKRARQEEESVPVIGHPREFPVYSGRGWTRHGWAGSAVFGLPLPMEAHRYRLDPDTEGPLIALAKQETLAYVISGSGSAGARGETFPLGGESVLWLAGCDSLRLRSGPAGLDLLVAGAWEPGDPAPVAKGPGTLRTRAAGPDPLCKVFAPGELPNLASTRDTRDRLDLVTRDVPVAARWIRADRIIYHPGDTAAAHYHTDCHHVFCVLAGSGLLYADERPVRLEAGMSALVKPGEVHWFENDRQQEFSFVEFWAPPPSGTVWTVAGDRCTWAPKS
jgi:mannose-6-phosphate isomerase-like protein (cupin superfamily)